MSTTEFGKYLKNIRTKRGLGVNQLAAYSGVSSSQISRMEKGERKKPKPDTIKKLSNALNVPYTEMMEAAGYIQESPVNENGLPKLTGKNEHDIAKQLEKILTNMDDGTALAFDGEPMDEETKALVRTAIESNLKLTKQLAKQKYTPKKYRDWE
ncbi:MAG: helix-turn-helix domain-containing protein [Sporolactobacillus sp.]